MLSTPPRRDVFHASPEQVRGAASAILARSGLAPIEALELLPRETANPSYLAAAGPRRYVVKLAQRHPDTLAQQTRIANGVRAVSGLPIPEHLAHASPGDPLPLLILEWLPGESLWQLFHARQDGVVRDVARAWGAGLAELHRTRLPSELPSQVTPRAHRGFAAWIRGILLAPTSDAERASGWSDDDGRALAAHVTPHFARLAEASRPGLTKADQDLRDVLACIEPAPRISGWLDWERVGTGDTLWEIAWLRVRLTMLGLDALWSPFRSGYESIAPALDEKDARLALYVLDSYVGGRERAHPYAVYVILHEIGHAIAKLYRERVLLQYRKDIATYNGLVDQVNRVVADFNRGQQVLAEDRPMKTSERRELERQQQALEAEIVRVKRLLGNARWQLGKMEKIAAAPTPMEQLYAQLPRALDGPTPYGRTDVSESFAESFALFHVDPDSLRRIAPEVHAWFASGEHLKLSNGPEGETGTHADAQASGQR